MGGVLFIQNDGKIFAHSEHPDFERCRNELNSFSVLIEQQNPMMVYKTSPASLWKAASLGRTPRFILEFLRQHSELPVPMTVQQQIVKEMEKWGAFRLSRVDETTLQLSFSQKWSSTLNKLTSLQDLQIRRLSNRILFPNAAHGPVKQLLAYQNIPVIDDVDYESSARLQIKMRPNTRLRNYQKDAVKSFFQQDFHQSGVILLPCGSGKTVVGLAILCKLGFHTLIVTPSDESAEQWIRECKRRTTIQNNEIGLYHPNHPLQPVTVTTYQRISGKNQQGIHRHLRVLTKYPFGFIIYDEVHVLPAPLFRLAAELQTARRLGLTATLVREDQAETDVFSLIGPTCYEGNWKGLEKQGYLAEVRCFELQIPLSPEELRQYNCAARRQRHRIAAGNSEKVRLVGFLLQKHKSDSVLIIGHYLDLLTIIASRYQLPLITGKTPKEQRTELYEQFRTGEIRCLVLSRVANMAIDLPQASVGIQVSGLYASRQEEAQRLGRLLRPKKDQAYFYSLVSANTVEVQTARKRQRFLVEHGYQYEIENLIEERMFVR